MLRLILRSPWPVHMVLAAALFAFAYFLFTSQQEMEAEKALALQQGVPEAVSLDVFDRKRDIHPADEVNVIGWVNFEHNYLLTETRKRKLSSTDVKRKMFVLFGPGDDATSKVAKAVILMPEHDVERFQEMAMETFIGTHGESFLFSLNGTNEYWPELYKMANEALEKQGLTKGPGFVFIEMWGRKGREAALQPDPTTGLIMGGTMGSLGVLMLLIGVWRFRTPYKSVYKSPVATLEAEARAEAEKAAKPKRNRGKTGLIVVAVILIVVGAMASGYGSALGAALPLLFIVALLLGLRVMGRAVSSGISRALGWAPAPEEAKPAALGLPAWAMVSKPAGAKADPAPVARDAGPVQTMPSFGARMSETASSRRFAKWMPFLMGLVIMVLSPRLIEQLGVPLVMPVGSLVTAPKPAAPMAQMATAPAPEAPAVAETVTAAPVPMAAPEAVASPMAAPDAMAAPLTAPVGEPGSALAFDLSAIEGMVANNIFIVFVLAALILGVKVYADRHGGRAMAEEPIERWEKIARQARAGRGAA